MSAYQSQGRISLYEFIPRHAHFLYVVFNGNQLFYIELLVSETPNFQNENVAYPE